MDIVSRKAILRQLLAEARANKERAEQDADRVRLRVAEKVPVYADMSGAISRILIGASRRVLEDPAHGKEISAKAQREVLELKKRSEEALRAAGYTPEMLAPKYHCPICKDTGFVGEPIYEYCSCIKTELARRMYDQANVGEETFEHFDLNVFSDAVDPETGRSQRQVMQAFRQYCENYADAFPEVKKRNLLLLGHTGLGKTYMLNCIAARMLERGVSVLRITAYKMLDAMRRYHRGQEDGGLEMMLNAEMLIIDDLGTEPMLENITVEYLFTLLNERRSGRLPTLIATNLAPRELQARYTERIFSRMVDRSDTELLHFIGQDVRLTRH